MREFYRKLHVSDRLQAVLAVRDTPNRSLCCACIDNDADGPDGYCKTCRLEAQEVASIEQQEHLLWALRGLQEVKGWSQDDTDKLNAAYDYLHTMFVRAGGQLSPRPQ